MHPRNLHRERYDFKALVLTCSELSTFLKSNPAGDCTIDFADPAAVLCLNRALLAAFYSIKHWAIPEGYLCPPIPGRADYIHHLADIIGKSERQRVLDIGTGANCIYPILGSQSYGWKFVGTDTDVQAVKSARAIVEANNGLKSQVRVLHQKDSKRIFKTVIKPADRFAAVMCNPPFHESPQAAQVGSQRKQRNLRGGRSAKGSVKLNFGGQSNELWCEGGEVQFIRNMITQSIEFKNQVGWFTSLVSKSAHVPVLNEALEWVSASEVRVVKMKQGSKQSRFIAWCF